MIGSPLRCVQGAPITVTFSPVDYAGEPSTTDPGVVTVGVTDGEGAEVVAPLTATTSSGVTRSYTLTAAHTAVLDRLTVTFTTAVPSSHSYTVDVVGAVYATSAEIRGTEPSLKDSGTTPLATILRARAEVEAMIERAINHTISFVPRFDIAAVTNDGSGSLRLPHYYLRTLRWVKYGNGDGSVFDFWPAGVGAVPADPAGLATLSPGSWPQGRLLVGYEHGLDGPPADMKRAAIAAVRHQVALEFSGIDSRAMSFQPIDGGNVILATPGLGPWVTGVPAIDEVLDSYRKQYPSIRVS